LGLLLGQGIGRFGNLINQELYGPPTGSPWFGMLIEQTKRLAEFQSFPADTRFHPTMLYEAFWLFLVFGVLFYLFRRYQEQIVHGVMTGAYLILAGLGRFVMEFWRPDQPGIPTGIGEISFSRMFAMLYVVVGIIVLLDRTGHMRIPLWKRPPSRRQRLTDYEEIQVTKRRRQRHQELEKRRAARRKERAAAAEPDSESQTETANESS
jgi:prolipoprotein diacylglyceryl transferase